MSSSRRLFVDKILVLMFVCIFFIDFGGQQAGMFILLDVCPDYSLNTGGLAWKKQKS